MAVVIGLHAYQGGPFAVGGFGASRNYPVDTGGEVAFTTVVSQGPISLGGGQYAWGDYASYPTGPWWSWATLEPILDALVPAGTDPVWLHGHSEGAAVAAEALRNGWDADGRLRGVVFDDPSDPWGALSNPNSIPVVLYATSPDGGSTWNVNTTNSPTVPTGVLEKYEAAFGITRKRSDLFGGPTSHGPMTRLGSSGPYAPPELLDAEFWAPANALTDDDGAVLVDHVGAAFTVPTVTVSGAAAATYSFTAAATGTPDTTGTATGTYTFTATTAGYRGVSSLTDPFSGATIDTSKWDVLGNATTQNDRLILPCQSTYDETVVSLERFTAKDGMVFVEVVALPTGTSTQAYIELRRDASNIVSFGVQNRVFNTWVRTGGVDDNTGSLGTYNASNHRWWRINFTGGNVLFQVAPSASGTWTTLHTEAAPAWVQAGSSATVSFGTGYFGTEAAPGNFEVDNLNVTSVAATASATFTLTAAVSGQRGATGSASALWELTSRHPLRDQDGNVVTSLSDVVALIDHTGETLDDSDGQTLDATEPVWVLGIGGNSNVGAPQGTASATWGFTAGVVGIRDRPGVAAATWQLAMSAVGAPGKTGTAVGTFELTATASGVPSRAGAAAASFTFTAAAAGVPETAGAASATFGFTATAAGVPDVTATATSTYGFTATVIGERTTAGTAVATWTLTATAVAEPVKAGQLNATWTLTATAAGERTTPASAQATWGFTATATGVPDVTGTASATWGFTGTASAETEPRGAASATWTFTGTAAGTSYTSGTASATYGFTAAVTGVRDTPGTAQTTWGFTAVVVVNPEPVPQRERTRVRRHRPTTSARRPRHTTSVRRHST